MDDKQKQSRYSHIKWFISRSKEWMDYGQGTSKMRFWLKFPGAAFRYWRLSRNG